MASRITLRKVAQDHVLQNRVLKKCIATLNCIVLLRIFNGGNLWAVDRKMIKGLLELRWLLLTVIIMAPSPNSFSCSPQLPSPQSHHRVFKGLAYARPDECFSLFGTCLWKDSCKQETLVNSVISVVGHEAKKRQRQTFLTDVKSFLELLNLWRRKWCFSA